MSSNSDAVPDPEAPRPLAHRRRVCVPLPWALSIALVLFAAAGAAYIIRTWVVPQGSASLRPSPAPDSRLPEVLEVLPDARARLPDSTQGEGLFAQLVARDVLLMDGLLNWYSDPGLKGVFLAPGLSYDEHTQELVVAESGIYYVFLHLELQRVLASAGSGSGSVSIALHLQPLGASVAGAAALALTLDLPSPSSEARDSAAGFRGGLLHLSAGQRLGVYLKAAAGVQPAWQLAQGATVLGLYCVSTKVPTGLHS
ncbi:tumor necrosis factor ligand superfamily member 9 [Sturnira hondurensis]|uniref:tumor necrosis factor ligand superfamily member 9 n=1 Tax=Sturnira hondurensis TaxID=192404 RepID=UPI00187A5F2A|nr:tumor necrosis factor ligand superfamily member 9 [Sturnira hondurensis]